MTDQTLLERARKAAGNWQEFDSFSWCGRNAYDQPKDWTIVYTNNRDSGLLAQSNAAAIEALMKRYIKAGTCVPERHTHWAVGWVDGYVLQVFTKRGKVTRAFETWCEIQDRLDDYSVLDEDDLSERETQACEKNFEQAVKMWHPVDDDGEPVDLPENAWQKLIEVNRLVEVDGCGGSDGQGHYPSDEELEADARKVWPELFASKERDENGEVIEPEPVVSYDERKTTVMELWPGI